MKKLGMLFILTAMMFLMPGGAPAWAVRTGGTFNWVAPYGGDFHTLDPHLAARTDDYLAILNLNCSLYRWNADTNKPVLELAKKVDVSPSGLVYTYHLYKDVKFHNGRTLTADDIIWSYERIMNSKTASPSARFVRIIKGAKEYEQGKADTISGLKKIDDFTLQITLASPVNPGYSLFQPGTAILPKEEVEKKGAAFGLSPVGCGPFEFVKWEKGSKLVLKKFPEFFKKGKPYLDKLVIYIMSEGASRDIAFRSGELDATIVGASQYPAYEKDPKISKHLMRVAEMYTRHIGFNPEFKPFADRRVRQAINYAINKKLIDEKLLMGKAYSAVGFLPKSSPAFDPNAKGYEYNVEKARRLMKEAGYEKGFEFTCLATNAKAFGAPVVEALIPFLRQINIKIKPEVMEGAAFAQRVFNTTDFDAYIWSVESGPDPLQVLSRWRSDNPRSSGNLVGYHNPKFDALLDKAAQERNPVKKNDFLRKANDLFTKDAPLWFFNHNMAVIAYQPWVHGIKPVAIEMTYQDFTNIWVDSSSPRAKMK